MKLTYEQHRIIRKQIRETIENCGLQYKRVSRDVGLHSNTLSLYLNGSTMSAKTIKKVFTVLKLDFSSFQNINEADNAVDEKGVYLVKKGDFYYVRKKKKRQYSFGWIVFYVDVYTARQSKAKVFSNLRIARRVAKRIDGQVVRLKKEYNYGIKNK